MNDTAILTRDREAAERLRAALALEDPTMASLPTLTRDDIEADPRRAGRLTTLFSTWYIPDFTQEEVSRFFPALRHVFYAAGTVKYFAPAFMANGVRVFSAARANGTPVAEFTAAQIVLANKGCFQAQRAYGWPIWRGGFFRARARAGEKPGNYRSVVGLVGCGAIGSMVARLLRPYSLTCLTHDPYLPDERAAALGVRKVGLEELFEMSDVVSNHLPDTSETRGLIGYSLLSRMKPAATFINTARGRQVVEADLARVLRRNKRMCALLDVTAHEPLFPWSPLYFCRNAFLTPHIAGSMGRETGRMALAMCHAYTDVAQGRASDYEITSDQLCHMA